MSTAFRVTVPSNLDEVFSIDNFKFTEIKVQMKYIFRIKTEKRDKAVSVETSWPFSLHPSVLTVPPLGIPGEEERGYCKRLLERTRKIGT